MLDAGPGRAACLGLGVWDLWLAPADAIALAVVGSRRSTRYGLEQAERFGELLNRAGLTVLSGGPCARAGMHRSAGSSRLIPTNGAPGKACRGEPPELLDIATGRDEGCHANKPPIPV